MKKFAALILALMLTLFSVSALAEAKTVTIRMNANPEVVKNAARILQTPEDQMNMVDAAVALINALGINVVATDNAAQIEITAKDQHVISLGGTVNDEGVILAGDLFPSYLVSISKETLRQMVSQTTQDNPVGQIDMEALSGKIMQHFSKFAYKLMMSITPGEAEAVVYEAEGCVFDTRTPQDVDVRAIAEAEKTLVRGLLSDETIVGLLKSVSDDISPEKIIRKNDEMMAEDRLPAVTAYVYSSSADPAISCTEVEAAFNDEQEPSYRCVMLDKGDGNVKVVFSVLKEGITITICSGQDSFSFEEEGNGAYAGIKVRSNQTATDLSIGIEIYFMDRGNALLRAEIFAFEGGGITLKIDPESQQVIRMEDIRNNTVDNSVFQGFIREIRRKTFSLLPVVIQAVPEAAPLVQLMPD